MCLCLKVSEPIMTLSSAYQVRIQPNIQKGISHAICQGHREGVCRKMAKCNIEERVQKCV